MKNLLFRWLKIYEDEIGLFCGMAVLLFFINSSSIVLNNFVETAFLKRYGVQYLPVINALNAVVTFFLLSSLGGVLARVRGDKMVGRTLIFSGVLIGLLRFVVPFGFDLLYPFLYILKTQFTVLLAFLFWNLANDLFNTRQSKRLFPLITTGGIIGGIAGSFATPLLARMVSSDNLLLLFALFSFAGALTVWQMGTKTPSTTLREHKKGAGEKLSMLGEFQKVIPLIKNSTLAQVLLMLTLLPNLVIPILNYQFSFVVDQTFATEAGMLSFYSYFRGAQNTIALIISLFVGRIYGRFGLPVALMFHPMNYLIAFAAYLFQFNIFSAVYAGTSVNVIRTTINNPASSALYGLLMPKDRTVLRTFLRGTVVRISILLGSGILWVGVKFMEPRYLSLMAIVFVAAWLGTTLLLKRRYASILINLLRGELPDFYRLGEGELQAVFKGVDVGPILLKRFRSTTGEEAFWYAEAMHSKGVKGLDEAILEKIVEADDATRLGLLPYLSERAGRPAIDAFMKIVDPEKPELMVALAQTTKRVFADMPEAMEREIFEMASNPEVKACFMGWLRKHEPEQLNQLISGWLDSEILVERRAGVLALKDSGRAEDVEILRRLLKTESDPKILALALRAFAPLQTSDLADQAQPFLNHPEATVRLAAVDALSPDCEPVIHALIMAMGDPDDQVRGRAIKRLESIPSSLLHILVDEIGSHSRRVREGLFQLGRTLDTKDVDIFRFCRNQLTIAYEALAQAESLDETPKTDARELLLKHLDEVAEKRVDNVVRGLDVRDTTGQIGLVLRGLRSGDERTKGDSIEAMDSLLDRSLTRILVPLLENQPRHEQLSVGRRYLDQPPVIKAEGGQSIARLLRDPDWVTVMLTVESIAAWSRVDEHRDRIEQLAAEGSKTLSIAASMVLRGPTEVGAKMSIGIAERVQHLCQIDLFRDLRVSDLVAVAAVAEELQFSQNFEVSIENEPFRGLYLIVSGEVSIEQDRPNSPSDGLELARYGPGQSLGVARLFGGELRNIKIRFLQDSVMLCISAEVFSALVMEHPEIALQAAKALSERLEGAVEVMLKQFELPANESLPDITAAERSLPGPAGSNESQQMEMPERVLQLRQIDLFKDLPTYELAKVAAVVDELRRAPGAEIFGDDEACPGLHLIVSGEVSIEQRQADNVSRSKELTRLGPGQPFAVATLFGGNISMIKVRAIEDTVLLRISREEFFAIAREHPVIALRTCQVLSQRLGGVLEQWGQSDQFHVEES